MVKIRAYLAKKVMQYNFRVAPCLLIGGIGDNDGADRETPSCQ